MSEKEEKKFIIVNYAAIVIGLLLIAASMYQIYFTIQENGELDSINEKIEDLEQIKADLLALQKEFHSNLMDLQVVDMQTNVNLMMFRIDTENASLKIASQAHQFWAAQDTLIETYFEYIDGSDGISQPFFMPKEKYQFLFNRSYLVYEEKLIEDNGNFSYVMVDEYQAIVQFTYIKPVPGVSYRQSFNMSNYDAKNLTTKDFQWNYTASIIFNETWTDPIDLTFRNDLFEIIITPYVIKQMELGDHVTEMQLSLIVNTVALLLIGFLIDIKDKKMWRNIYFIVAVLLTLYSLVGVNLIQQFILELYKNKGVSI
jgi:hypothetical protein